MKLTQEIVRELLHYDPDTGIFTWRERDRSRFRSLNSWAAWNGRYAGKRAGGVWTCLETGYQCRRIGLLGRSRAEHHLAWMWMTGEPLPLQIDHENRDGTDNRWRNLRASDNARNARNQSMKRTNTSGITGVTWSKERGKWQAQCKINGKSHNLGRFEDIDEAARAVAKFRAERGFNPGHGMEHAHYHQEKAS